MNKKANSIIYINGQIHQPEDAVISVFDRGFLFGDSVYEVTRTYNGKVFLWDEHYDRLQSSASKIGMHLPFSKEFLKQEIERTHKELRKKEVFIRVIVTRGEGGFSMDPTTLTDNNLIIMVKEMTNYPEVWYRDGVHVIIASTHRTDKDSLDPNIKSGNYLNNVMAYMEAAKQHVYDAIMLNSDGYVTEATTSNLWIVKNGEVMTPPLKAGILEGITRRTILMLASNNKIKTVQRNFYPDEMINADECFLTSSTKEIIPITQIDGAPVGGGTPGAVTKSLHQFYKQFVAQHS